jgi:hypothetical protein
VFGVGPIPAWSQPPARPSPHPSPTPASPIPASHTTCCNPPYPQHACATLSELSARGGPDGGNGETLLELHASFFSLLEGLAADGWVAPAGADLALRGWVRKPGHTHANTPEQALLALLGPRAC